MPASIAASTTARVAVDVDATTEVVAPEADRRDVDAGSAERAQRWVSKRLIGRVYQRGPCVTARIAGHAGSARSMIASASTPGRERSVRPPASLRRAGRRRTHRPPGAARGGRAATPRARARGPPPAGGPRTGSRTLPPRSAARRRSPARRRQIRSPSGRRAGRSVARGEHRGARRRRRRDRTRPGTPRAPRARRRPRAGRRARRRCRPLPDRVDRRAAVEHRHPGVLDDPVAAEALERLGRVGRGALGQRSTS